MLATKLKLHVAPLQRLLKMSFCVVHVPPLHEKKSLVPAVRRVEPWLIHPWSCSPVTVGVPKVKFAVAVPSLPPMNNWLVTEPLLMCATTSAQPMLLKQQVNPPTPMCPIAVAP